MGVRGLVPPPPVLLRLPAVPPHRLLQPHHVHSFGHRLHPPLHPVKDSERTPSVFILELRVSRLHPNRSRLQLRVHLSLGQAQR